MVVQDGEVQIPRAIPNNATSQTFQAMYEFPEMLWCPAAWACRVVRGNGEISCAYVDVSFGIEGVDGCCW